MARAYQIAMELEDGTVDAPLPTTYANKATAIRVARFIARSPSFQCVKIWVDRAEDGQGVWSKKMPKWEG